jgi:hypothetical protein
MRTSTHLNRNKQLIDLLGESLKIILEEARKNKDYWTAKNCLILSQTFYYLENDKKIFSCECLKKNKWLETYDFWDGVCNYMIDEEFKKPVKKDDGWGDVEYYDSFDEFVRKEMQSKLKNDWDMRRIIERKLDNAVKHAKERLAQKVVETELVDEVIAELQPKDFSC